MITDKNCQGWLEETARWMKVTEHGFPLGELHDARDALYQYGLGPQENLFHYNKYSLISDNSDGGITGDGKTTQEIDSCI